MENEILQAKIQFFSTISDAFLLMGIVAVVVLAIVVFGFFKSNASLHISK